MHQITTLEKESENYLKSIHKVVESHIKKTKRMVQKLEKLDKDLQKIINDDAEEPIRRTRKKREVKDEKCEQGYNGRVQTKSNSG